MAIKLFITGISTDVGKTITAAILVEALQADYWKPIQAGNLEQTDTMTVQSLISNSKSIFFEPSYALQMPASPHAAAENENIMIELSKIIPPKTENHLIIEGAGGLLVPLNDTDMVVDLIQADDKVILVSQHYLGSINHTLLSVEVLKNRGIKLAGIIFNGSKNEASESIILKKTQAKHIGNILPEAHFDQEMVAKYALLFKEKLMGL
jgi:dethiobiotin synthetase